ncbi:tripartite tricarboxylate transporter TctB family protein [Paraburkholderia sp. ZP32-5]|uniref:tripartite tricarboxylate transporter TctB family protein n=1 Tax=Paraburkholderia sp. ZP32-5 TaxID=2883245 RepID=UPI001F170365|nr:tripartite tricarboxylate transporter TctB family protein [Paraburkholderia sp. ZP32-5]
MVLIGLGSIHAGLGYDVGSLSRMGPGFFPVAVGTVLLLCGLAIAASARAPEPLATIEEAPPPEWRAWACIVIGIMAFVVLGQWGGLLPATFAIVFISALGDRDNTVVSALVLAVAMCVVCALVFSWGLKLQFPLLSWG